MEINHTGFPKWLPAAFCKFFRIVKNLLFSKLYTFYLYYIFFVNIINIVCLLIPISHIYYSKKKELMS